MVSMSEKERAAYATWKRACAAAREEEPSNRERCGTLLGLAAVTVLLIGLMGLGGARADEKSCRPLAADPGAYARCMGTGTGQPPDNGPPMPTYDVDGACAAYVDAGLSIAAGSGISRAEKISICVEWEQREYDELRAKWGTYPSEARSGCQREVAEKISRGSIQGVDLGNLGQRWSKASEAWGYDWLSACVETYRAEPKRFKP
jgi:hypothetical protein